MKELLVAIPYYAPGAQGRELELAIRGWRKYYIGDARIVVIGETKPNAGEDDFIISERVPGRDGQYRPHLDYVECFRKLYQCYGSSSKGFVWAADDNYLVSRISKDFFQYKYANGESFAGICDSTNGWKVDQWKTRQLLDAMHRPHINYTTHIPCWFDFVTIIKMFNFFDMEHYSYVIEDLYYNIYDDGRQIVQLHNWEDGIRIGVWSQDTYWKKLESSIDQVKFICNSNDGWCPRLERILAKRLGI